jgi:hypothetical protein
MEEVLAHQKEWMREQGDVQQRCREASHTTSGTPNQQQNHHNDNANAQSLPLPLKHTHDTVHNMDNNNIIQVIPFEHHNKSNEGAICTWHEKDDIKLFTHRLGIPADSGRDWVTLAPGPTTHPHMSGTTPHTPTTCLDAPCSILACTPRLHNVCHLKIEQVM